MNASTVEGGRDRIEAEGRVRSLRTATAAIRDVAGWVITGQKAMRVKQDKREEEEWEKS